MKRNLFAFLAFFALTLGMIQAQSILTIQGQVTDDSTGAAVANRPVMVKADTLFLPGGGGPGTGGGQPIGFLGMDVTDSNGYYQIDIDLALFTGTQVYVVTHGCLLTHYVVPVQAIAGVTTVNFNVCVMVPGGGNPGGGHPGGGNPGGGNPGGGNPGGGHPGGGNPGGGNPGGGLPGMGCHAYFGGHPDTANLLTWNFNTMPKSPTATYDWSFGDGNTASGLNVSNTYVAFGQYNVCLVLTDTAFQCADTFCKLINVDSTFNPGGGHPGGGNPGGGNPGGGNPGGGNPGGGNPGGGHPGGGLPGMGCHAYFGGHPDTANLLTWNFNTMPKSPTATYDWSFGDGNTASGLNVSNTYVAFGQYNVCLVLTDTAFQCADTFCKLINVDSTFNPGGGHPGGGNPGGGNPGGGNPGGGHPGGGNPGGGHPGGGLPGMGCHAYFGGHPDTADLLTWNFHTMPKSPTATYDWSFGDGNTASGLNVSNTYSAFGQYNVCLVLTDTAYQCVDTFCMLVEVDSTFNPGGGHPGGGNPGGGNPGGGQGMNCNADFAWFVDSSNNVVFNDLSTPVPTSWAWDFGDGNTSVSQNPVYAYASAGTYYVTLDIGYTNCSCTDSTSQSVTVAVSVSMVMGTAQITGIEYVSDIYPNPVNDICRLDMEVREAGEVMVSLLDLSGREIQSQTRTMNRGMETIELNTASLKEGVYLLVVRHQNGTQFTRKLNRIR